MAGIETAADAAPAIAPLGIKGAADGGGEICLVGAGGKGVCACGGRAGATPGATGGMGRDVIGGRAGK